MSLNLSVSEHEFAVCRLPSHAPYPPSWIRLSSDGRSSFLSVTRTVDELSVVCRQDCVALSNDDLNDERKIEYGWKCIKVQGPLDFGLTGVLASLAGPLAEAKIPIFAVSTYDTDYLLLKQEYEEAAIETLTAKGHKFVSTVLTV